MSSRRRGDGGGGSDRSRAGGSSGRRAQTETLGVVLLLGIAAIGTGMIVMFGNAALDDTRQASEVENAAHVMTQFDSRAAQVALGGSSAQSVAFGRLSGQYEVRPSAGRITIEHENWDGNGSVEEVYQADLGAYVYENEGTTLAYQGGGVWRTQRDGNATMVSPPEFHYRQATLTLPVIRVVGDDSVGGGGPTARVTEASGTSAVYPNESAHYDGNSSEPTYANPADEGTLRVTVESEFYAAWASYFRTRTAGTVTVDHGAGSATVELVSKGQTGTFDMPGEGSDVEVRGVTGHDVTDYEMDVRSTNPNFANLEWSTYYEDGDTEFEMHVDTPSGSGKCGDAASLTIYYTDDTIAGHHGWYDDDAFTIECPDGEETLVMGLVDADDDDPELTYQDVSGHLQALDAEGSAPAEATLDGHGASWEPADYDRGTDVETTDRLLNHYFAEMGDFDLTVDDHNRDSVDEGDSGVDLEYGGSGRYITYLHVTDNEIRVDLE